MPPGLPTPLSFIDTHCHLDVAPLNLDTAAVIGRAVARGVHRIVAPAYDLRSWSSLCQLRKHAEISIALGLHPWVAPEPLETQNLRVALLENRAIAVGEIGLDSKVSVPLSRQIEVLKQQLQIGLELDLPALLHCRGAHEQMLQTLDSYPTRGVVHAFSRGPELAQRFLDKGLYVAFGGTITRPNATRARRAAARVPLERILLETDAPSIGLDGVPPESVEPHHVADVAVVLAEIRGVSVAEIARVTTQNARELFRFP
ncbi:MAG: hypothetical protein A2289_14825 [Deltaproteobacteria bacterium RIFOXYA12_FULL_58_15]|nr:MAG: hypothetical protein A2289_14825 [Deltaproteobacteria bacterium RIFOXYA12_FULL_58_15]OGR09768.1 MAG: hypothetical protein A2341_13225 [Deltaproteobacteria bacterium RIFOXYB12_FULL_58_9]